MARRKRTEDAPPVQSRKQILRERKERQERQVLLTIFVPVLVLVVLLLGWGAFREMYQKPRTPVAKVNDTVIRADSFIPRVQYERYQTLNSVQQFMQFAQVQSDSGDFLQQYASQARTGVVDRVVDSLVDEALISEEAERRGITVTDEEVDEKIYGELTTTATPVSSPTAEVITTTSGVTVTATVSPTATMSEGDIRVATREAERLYDQYIIQSLLQVTGLTEPQYREIVRRQLLREKVQEALAEEVETTATQVEAEYLLFQSLETAQAAHARLESGATWAVVVEEYENPDTDTATDPSQPMTSTDSAEVEPATEPLTDTAEIELPTEPLTETDTLTDTDTTDSGSATDTDQLTETGAVTDTATTGATSELTTTDGLTEADETTGEVGASEPVTATGAVTPTVQPSPTPLPYALELGESRWYSRDGLKDRLGFSDTEATSVLELEAGSYSDPVDGRQGTYIVHVTEVEDARELEAGELDTRKASALEDWLSETRTRATIDRYSVTEVTPPEPDWYVAGFQEILGTQTQPLQDPLQVSTTAPPADATAAPPGGAAPPQGGAPPPAP